MNVGSVGLSFAQIFDVNAKFGGPSRTAQDLSWNLMYSGLKAVQSLSGSHK